MEDIKHPNPEGQGYWEEKAGLENLLKENIRYSKAIFADTQKIRRYMKIRMIFNIVWLILVFAPLIFAVFWLPQAIGGILDPIQSITGDGAGTLDLLKQLQQLN